MARPLSIGAPAVGDDDQAWIGIDCLDEFLGIDDLRLVDAVLAFAPGLRSTGAYPINKVISLARPASIAR